MSFTPHSVTTLVGDVIGSRSYPDQATLLADLDATLRALGDEVPALQPLTLTIGDEFQGVYRRLGDALEALVRLRARLGSVGLQVRVGLGRGEIIASDVAEPPRGQSGSGWWSAREALDSIVARNRSSQSPRSLRTAFCSADGEDEALVNAFLICADELFDGMDERDLRLLLGALDGERQADLAAELGITQPAVAKRMHANGINALLRAFESAAR